MHVQQILFLVFCSYEITGVTYGTGHHFADIPVENFSKAMQVSKHLNYVTG